MNIQELVITFLVHKERDPTKKYDKYIYPAFE